VDQQRTSGSVQRSLRRLLLACSLAIAFAAAQASAASAEFQKSLPVNPGQLTDAKLNAALDLAREAGVTQIQSHATWWWLTRNGGARSYDWTDLDRLVAAAEARGMDVVLQLNGTPDWVHPDLTSSVPNMMDRIWYPPVRNQTELQHWSNFVKDLATRYRGRVSQYEIWNEQNWRDFWKPEENVDDYARMLRASYYAARQADPAAKVVFGGMTTNDIGYLQAYYDSVDRQWPNEATSQRYFFDILGVHPYSADRSPRVLDPAYTHSGKYGEIDRNFLGFRKLKQLMGARESVDKPVFIGEYGFSTTDTWMGAVPDHVRAQHLRDAYNLAAAEGYVTAMSWYAFVPNTATGPEWTLVDGQLNPGQSFEALRNAPSGDVPTLITPAPRTPPTPPPATPPDAGPGPEATDSDAPDVRIRLVRRVKMRRAVSRGVPVAVHCSEACEVKTEVTARRVRRRGRRTRQHSTLPVGRASGEVAEPGEVRLRIRLRRAVVKRLARDGRRRISLNVVARDDAGNQSVEQRAAVVLR
jgi:hypothetical protein